ncbi:hypothetical protein [Pseudovibrio exalbescens]|uniref:hypothetical protein n=1 Tax=Pseudovibrio exalbescens TaxID=197461 RepID=UPI0012DC1821|nr:hypothetical protein [Pseudovibrio exalbescens]
MTQTHCLTFEKSSKHRVDSGTLLSIPLKDGEESTHQKQNKPMRDEHHSILGNR